MVPVAARRLASRKGPGVMPSLDRVNAAPSRFIDGDEGDFTLLDLAYEEYVAHERDGAATAHVEAYWAHLAFAAREEDIPLLG